jgi:hypothetical protein
MVSIPFQLLNAGRAGDSSIMLGVHLSAPRFAFVYSRLMIVPIFQRYWCGGIIAVPSIHLGLGTN